MGGKKLEDKLWQSRQVRSLMKALVARRGVVITSEQLIEMLWPEDDPETALKRLYVRISQLRKLLDCGSDFTPIQSVPGGYVFVQPDSTEHVENPGQRFVWVDVDGFEQAADQGSDFLEQKQLVQAAEAFELARQLYRSDYLTEDQYVEWTIAERERLHERYLVVLTELSEAYAQQGLFRRSINLCQHILCLEPWREAVFLRLMLYFYYSGDKSKALQTYDQCQRVLQDQIGVTPDPHTMWIAKCIQDGTLWSKDGAAAYPPPAYEGRLFEVPYSLGDPPFVGRDRELAWMLEQWRRHATDCIWISGEAGVGKTRLAAAFCFTVEDNGVDVIRISAVCSASELYAALIAVLDLTELRSAQMDLSSETQALLTHIFDHEHDTQLDASPAERDSGKDQQLCRALIEFLQKKSSPVLICIDDAHILDESSLQIIADLIGKVGLLLTSRVDQVDGNHPLIGLINENQACVHGRVLTPWGVDDVRQLLFDLGGEEVSGIAGDLYEKSLGNPLFIIASLQHLFEEGLLYVTLDGQWAQSGPFEGAVAPSIEKAIAQRLNLVQSDDRLILDVLAVAGGEADYDVIQTVLNKEENSLLICADRLISKGLIFEPRDLKSADLVLVHGLYREVLYQSLPKARQRIFHRRIAEAMLSTEHDEPAQARLIANHFYRGAELIQASQYARLAGEHALRTYSPSEALQHYQTALSWVEGLEFDDKQKFKAQVRLGLAEAERFLGHYETASEHYQRALPFLQGTFKEAAVFQLFNLQLLQGKPLSVYEDQAKEYEPLVRAEGDTWALALFYWSKSFIDLMRGDAQKTRLQQAEGWRIARRLCEQGVQPPPWIYQRAFSILMRAHNQWGHYSTSIHFADRVLSENPQSVMNPNTQAVVSASLGESYTGLGKFDRAEEAYQKCSELARAAGDPRLKAVALLGLAEVSLMRGDFELAQDFAQQVFSMSDPPADILRQMLAQYLRLRVAIKTRVDDEHFAIMDNLLAFTRYINAQPYSVIAMLTQAEMFLIMGETDKADERAQKAAQLAELCKMKREACAALRLLAESKAVQGDLDTAHNCVNQSLNLAQRIQAPYEIGLCTRTRAGFQSIQQRALDDASHALKLFEAIGSAYEAQLTRVLLSELMDRSSPVGNHGKD